MNTDEPRWAVAILAAGRGTRMRSHLPKVLHHLSGRPLLDHVIDLALGIARPHDIMVVVGHEAETVTDVVRERGVGSVLQEPQLGTGDALRVAIEGLKDRPTDRILVLSGDVPLLRAATLERLTGAVVRCCRLALLPAVSVEVVVGRAPPVVGEDPPVGEQEPDDEGAEGPAGAKDHPGPRESGSLGQEFAAPGVAFR